MIQMNKPKISFDEYEVEPSPGVWDNIVKNLPEPKRKKRVWIYLPAAAIFAGIVAGSYFLDIDIKLKHTQGNNVATSPSTAPNPERTNSDLAERGHSASSTTNLSSSNSNSGSLSASSGAISPVMKTGTATEQFANKTGATKSGNSFSQRLVSSKEKEAQPGNGTGANSTLEASIALEGENSSSAIALLAGNDITFTNKEKQMPSSLYAPPSDITTSGKKSNPRWQYTLLGSADYSYRNLNVTPSNSSTYYPDAAQLSASESGLHNYSTSATGAYSISTHFSVLTGVRYFSEGQKRSQSDVVLTGGHGGSATSEYAIVTSAGSIQGNGHEFDVAYFSNGDSTLFTGATAILANSPKDFELIQQFQYFGIPAMVQYQPAERRFTPYVGLGFSLSYLTNAAVTINGTDVDYKYVEKPDPLLFAAEAMAGVKYNLSGHFAFRVQPSLRYGLNAINDNESAKWIPYSFGLGFGITYR
jgi:hypothetical protein